MKDSFEKFMEADASTGEYEEHNLTVKLDKKMETNHTTVSCLKLKDWEKDGKKVPIYEVIFSDGRKGQSFGKEIPNGTLLTDLLLEEGQYGIKIKLKSAQGGAGGFKKSPPNNAAFSMAYAKDLLVAGKITDKQLIGTAELMFQWIESKNK